MFTIQEYLLKFCQGAPILDERGLVKSDLEPLHADRYSKSWLFRGRTPVSDTSVTTFGYKLDLSHRLYVSPPFSLTPRYSLSLSFSLVLMFMFTLVNKSLFQGPCLRIMLGTSRNGDPNHVTECVFVHCKSRMTIYLEKSQSKDRKRR